MRNYAIFWILGNENPPRDTPGRRLEILDEILREVKRGSYAEADCWFLLNRIVDIPYRREVLERISLAGCRCITIPLDPSFDVQDKPEAEIIRWAVNINAARNFAVDWARDAGYGTTVIFDGDCLFNAEGWSQFLETAEANPNLPHLSIPHVNSYTYTEQRPPGERAGEPMVAFRSFASRRFPEGLLFGHGDKLALLRELGHDMTPNQGHCELLRRDITASAGYCLHLQTGSDVARELAAREFLRRKSMQLLAAKLRKRQLLRNPQFNVASDHIPGFFDYSGQYSAVAFDAPDNSHGVEVGCWLGKSVVYLAAEFAGYGKRVQIDCVDSWDGGKDESLLASIAAMGGPSALFDAFCLNIDDSPQIGKVHRMSSTAAAALYSDESLDFVFIDAGHTYEEVAADIQAWLPKVKPGGLLFGHDFAVDHPLGQQVARAVYDSLPDVNLEVMPAGRVWKHVKLTESFRERRWV